MATVITTSANLVGEPTGAETPADALGVTKRMSSYESAVQERDDSICPTCGETYANRRAVKIHHKKIHDESLRIQECDWCGEEFEGKPRRVYCRKECQNAAKRGGEKPSAETLQRMHHDEETPLCEMADELGFARITIARWMEQYGVKHRGRSEAERLKNEQRTPEERRRQARAAHEKTRRMVKNGEWHLQTDNPKRNGYGEGWTEEKRESVREEYNRRCQACGMTGEESREQFGCRLDVHHIMPWSRFDDPAKRNAEENLVPLCRSCHRNWEGIPLRPAVLTDK